MTRDWTFGQKLAAGFTVIVGLSAAIAAVAVYALNHTVASKDRVITLYAPLLADAERVRTTREAKSAAARAYLLTREERFLDAMREARGEFSAVLERLKARVPTDEGTRLIESLRRAEAEHNQALEQVIALRRTSATLDAVGRAFEEDVRPTHAALEAAVEAFASRQQRLLEEAQRESTATAATAVRLVAFIALAVVLCALAVAVALTRSLSRQIGSAVGLVQSSSAELQSAASQQATGAKQQATAMGEITTTISELLATSRQIAESARHVARIAGETTQAAHSGEGTLEQANESIAGMRRQMDLVVSRMLELGHRSQEIGGVVEIVSELAEQTNILAINATIEAAGAGEAGKRFAVVADEIRKLADRVSGSAKEIARLIDDVRGAVNTTVMTTETGSKAVESGTRLFAEVAAAFRLIAGLVATTTEATREIELSTQQQTTAVEQVNVAVTEVAQATREAEASADQTLQTARSLAGLSRELLRLVQPQPGA